MMRNVYRTKVLYGPQAKSIHLSDRIDTISTHRAKSCLGRKQCVVAQATRDMAQLHHYRYTCVFALLFGQKSECAFCVLIDLTASSLSIAKTVGRCGGLGSVTTPSGGSRKRSPKGRRRL